MGAERLGRPVQDLALAAAGPGVTTIDLGVRTVQERRDVPQDSPKLLEGTAALFMRAHSIQNWWWSGPARPMS